VTDVVNDSGADAGTLGKIKPIVGDVAVAVLGVIVVGLFKVIDFGLANGDLLTRVKKGEADAAAVAVSQFFGVFADASFDLWFVGFITYLGRSKQKNTQVGLGIAVCILIIGLGIPIAHVISKWGPDALGIASCLLAVVALSRE
jgi:hypothetical protein